MTRDSRLTRDSGETACGLDRGAQRSDESGGSRSEIAQHSSNISPPTCSDCGKGITRKNRSGKCRSCLWTQRQYDPAFQAKRMIGIVARAGPSYRPGRKCRDCNKSLWTHNRTGLCTPCYNRDPNLSAKRHAAISAAHRRRIAEDPAYAAQVRENARLLAKTRAGLDAVTPAARARAAKKLSAKRLAWCPPEYRDYYRKQRRRFKTTARAKEETRRKITADLAALTPFERQLHAIQNGARLVVVPAKGAFGR